MLTAESSLALGSAGTAFAAQSRHSRRAASASAAAAAAASRAAAASVASWAAAASAAAASASSRSLACGRSANTKREVRYACLSQVRYLEGAHFIVLKRGGVGRVELCGVGRVELALRRRRCRL